MFELIIVPGSPALLLADAAGARLLATARSAHPATGQIDIVGSRDPRWYTARGACASPPRGCQEATIYRN